MHRARATTRALLIAALFSVGCSTDAQVSQQHPYRQSLLRTKVKVRCSRDKQSQYRYSTWGNLTSSDRRYTQTVRLAITVKNVSPTPIEGLRLQYRIYKRDLAQDQYGVAAAGEINVPYIATGKTKTLLTDEATCQYRLRWNSLARGNRSSKSGQKYAGYVVIYRDRKGPICWDVSSGRMYAEYAGEIRKQREAKESKASSPEGTVSSPTPEKLAPLPHFAEGTVYVSKTGRRFHRKSCRYVRGGAIAILRKDALNSGYTSCSVCKP